MHHIGYISSFWSLYSGNDIYVSDLIIFVDSTMLGDLIALAIILGKQCVQNDRELLVRYFCAL